ncbi:MAG: hypothetical protein EOP02_36440 [Proteobacteria bacterium]|nr:MAG: hypothetical protein EOP02_36440 [Pseudomonadota bacterium]
MAAEGTVTARLRALPSGTALPDGLVAAMQDALPNCVAEDCIARALPMVGVEIWLVGPVAGGFWVMQLDGAGWHRLGVYELSYTCWERGQAAMVAGELRSVPPPLPDLELGGVLMRPTFSAVECR